MYGGGFFALVMGGAGVVGSAVNTTPRSSSATYTSDVGACEVRDEDIIETSVDPVREDLHGKKVSTPAFDPQNYSREKTWLTISRLMR